jgi:hypothetical protein
MRVSTNFALPLSAVLFGLLLIPRAALAQVNNCPPEPASNVPLADGGIFTGANCTLLTDGDVDSFVFNGTSGDTYQLAVAINGAAQYGPNFCLTLYDTSAKQIFSGCSDTATLAFSVVTDQTLTATGRYTIDVTEPSTGKLNYAVSLERLYPFPPNAQQVTLATVVAGDITPLTDSNAFTFGVATTGTTGTYQVTATLPSIQFENNLCMTVYFPDGASAGSGCTDSANLSFKVQIDVKQPQAGTYMAFLTEAGNDGTATYNLEVSCLVGTCKLVPSCTLADTLNYASGTLTMKFTVENTYATTWNIWLTDQNTMQLLYSASQQITESPTPITKTTPLAPEGKVGILSTLTTPTNGITCSSWAQIQTGAP